MDRKWHTSSRTHGQELVLDTTGQEVHPQVALDMEYVCAAWIKDLEKYKDFIEKAGDLSSGHRCDRRSKGASKVDIAVKGSISGDQSFH